MSLKKILNQLEKNTNAGKAENQSALIGNILSQIVYINYGALSRFSGDTHPKKPMEIKNGVHLAAQGSSLFLLPFSLEEDLKKM